jgi:N-acetylglucosamine-6-phosphate deacetylase
MRDRITIKAIHYETMSPVEIILEDGLIRSIRTLPDSEPGGELLIAAPGLIDNQVNGYSGVDFSGDQLSVDGVAKATRALWKAGVTTYLPTLITNSPQNLVHNFRVLATSLSVPEVSLSVPGFHLEGPYLSKLDGFRGCHPEEYLADPDVRQFKLYQEAAGGKIIQITLAPELPGVMDLISYCRNNGILTAIGHSNANTAEIESAVQHGVTLSTHLGNGCGNLIHRHFNPLWPQLANDQMIPTIIADGHHLLPEELKVFFKVKGAEHIILTSDITYLAGMPPGRYSFGGADVILTEDGRLRSADQDVLAGATLPLLKGIQNMVNHAGCTLGEAINMASKNVARVFGWNDRGELLPGKRADILLLKKQGTDLEISQCFISGQPVSPYS